MIDAIARYTILLRRIEMVGSALTLPQALDRALSAYKAGRFTEAEQICLRITSSKYDFFDALHLLAVVRAALGKNDLALASYDRALRQRPNDAEALNNRGITLHELRRFDEAVTSFDRALLVRPNYADALYSRGNALRELKRFDEALGSYDRVLSLQPDYVEALNNRGITLRALKRFDEALMSYDRALSLRPNDAEALNNRGNTLHALKRFGEALASYDRALSTRPDYADALTNRGITLRALKRFDEALASFDRALLVRPDHSATLSNSGVILTELGRFAEACDRIEKALRLSPKDPQLYFSLAMSKHFAAEDPLLADMQELAQKIGSLNTEQQIYLHFALSKALGDTKQHERSFHQLLQGNALKRQQVAYDEPATLQLFQRIQTVFTSELIQSKHSLGNLSDLPIFIVGMPRSGSTLVEQILASHPQVFGAGERDHFGTAITRVLSHGPFPEGITAMSKDQLRQLGKSYLDLSTMLAPKAARITDKMLLNFRFVGLIHLALPRARIIHIRRDPVDTCLSCFSTLFTDNQPFSYDLGELGRFYHAYQVLMRHWHNVLPKGVMLELRYEEVVDDLEAQARRLVAHCGLDWDDACLAFHRTERPVETASAVQVRQPIYRSSIGRWRPRHALLRPLLEALDIRFGPA